MDSIEKIDIRELLPQQPPFVMVDRLLYFDDITVTSALTVREDNIFVRDGRFSEFGVMENIAQTGAARMGYIGKYIEKGNVKLGFIGEIKKMSVERCPELNECLFTTVKVVNEVLSTLLVHAEVKIGEELIASGEMKIFMTNTEAGKVKN